MEVGVYVDAYVGVGDKARELEEAGFATIWIYDSPLVFGDPYMALLDAARATDHVMLGPGVTHPLARPPFATAQALATLATAAPGRVVLGMGIGNSARWSLGMPPATLDTMYEHLRVVKGLLAGETVEFTEGTRSHPIRFLNPEGRWLDLSERIEVWVSAFGPVGQRRAGRVADGVTVRWTGPEAMAEARQNVAAGAREAGRDPASVKIGVLFAVYPVEDPDELEGDVARTALGPHVISRLRYLTANHASADDVPPAFRKGFEDYVRHREGLDAYTRHVDNYQGYLVSVPDHLKSFVTSEAIRSVAFVDDAEGVAREFQRMADAGVDHAALQITGPPQIWAERMGSDVLPQLR